jgi:glycerophosphoryl diester phosphodiesterase
MRRILAWFFLFLLVPFVHAGVLMPGGVQLLCHRTANEDVPENTLESLEQAALLGCNVVEIDLRRTLDGKIVLNHDGILERLTDGIGEVENTYYGDLELRDAGAWMGDRFAGLHIVLLEDALRLAREQDIQLVLDMKTKGMGADVLQIVQREGMLKRVQFGGEWSDVKKLYPAAADAGKDTVWVQPGVTADLVKQYHRTGKAVVANFSANGHEMDLAGMKAAVAAGVDGINVDYPRLGADAVGRPVEEKVRRLVLQANSCESKARIAAILELSRYKGLPLQNDFMRWLLDADDHVSRAAAFALVTARPQTPAPVLVNTLRSGNTNARANAAWALGMLHAPASTLLPLLQDKDPRVLQATLLALGRLPGSVDGNALLPFLSHDNASVRGAAAVALAQQQPDLALHAIPKQLEQEIRDEQVLHSEHIKHANPESFTQQEIDAIMTSFKCQMEMVRALYTLKSNDATRDLEMLAFRPGGDFSIYNSIIAAFQLWDRIGENAVPAIQALASSDEPAADRAEWLLVKAGPLILPEVRKALDSDNIAVRQRAIRIVAWQGDSGSLGRLKSISAAKGQDAALAAWAIGKIESLNAE